MGPLGHISVGFAAKRWAPTVPLGVLVLAAWILDIMAIALMFAGVEGGAATGNPWSHGLFMSVVWSVLAALLIARIFRSRQAGIVVGLVVFSHWLLDLISHPIPFPSFSWRSWQWSYGHPMPPDLPLLLGSPKVGFGLYNSISAVGATLLELAMFLLGATLYVAYLVKKGKNAKPQRAASPS